jgi:hypothetical protein
MSKYFPEKQNPYHMSPLPLQKKDFIFHIPEAPVT